MKAGEDGAASCQALIKRGAARLRQTLPVYAHVEGQREGRVQNTGSA